MNAINVPCRHCHAKAGAPCVTVGKKPTVEPHMRRLEDAGLRCDFAALREAYAMVVVTQIFGRCDDELLKRARRDRSIDFRKQWVGRAIEQTLLQGGAL